MFLRDAEGVLQFYPQGDFMDEFNNRMEALMPLAGDMWIIKEDGEAYRL